MEVGKGLKTLECLRGRLLAERQASRSAKEEAELMGEKVMSNGHGHFLHHSFTFSISLRNYLFSNV